MFIDFTGVISVAVEGADKDQLVVIGECVDSANLTCSLRKKLCYATLLGVEEVKEEKKEPEPVKPKPEEEKKPSTSSTCCTGCIQLPVCPQYPPYPTFYEVAVYDPSPSYCYIMWPTFFWFLQPRFMRSDFFFFFFSFLVSLCSFFKFNALCRFKCYLEMG